MAMEEGSYDAVVVGSGYGGSVAACRLAMAGVRVCLIEKGRRWEAEDFPVDSLGLMSKARMEWRRWGFGLGSKKALLQLHDQDDSLIGVACGLGGGSLINAGVMAPAPVRARRDPRWPNEWKRDWEMDEISASSMLGVQSVPVEFPNTLVMRQVTDEEGTYRSNPIKVSINFGLQETPNTAESPQLGSCLACGNCLSGCPYNAKNSTDKNYLASATQAGCVVKTECKVLYILRNPNEDSGLHDYKDEARGKRWRVCFEDMNCICADFVVLSAGVLGTTEIMFQSKRRGLSLSDKLGYGLSCNGNNVAYVAGSQAPLNAYGLTKMNVLNVPFKSRPGPAISSSYISSLGFTIQSAMLPTSYPYLLFKGISTFGWPVGFWFLHGIIDKFNHLVSSKSSQAMVLNVMGYDDCNGRIELDEESDKIHITPPHDPLLPKKIKAFQNLTRKLGGILFMSKYRSTSVHLLGGCNAASDPLNGVCNPRGQVFSPTYGESGSTVHEGLYVCDASVIPCSIGINPSLTIATIAEHLSRNIVQDILRFKTSNINSDNDLRSRKNKQDTEFTGPKTSRNIIGSLNTELSSHNEYKSASENITIKETMRGFIGGMPCTAYLVMRMNVGDNEGYNQKNSNDGQQDPPLKGSVGGYVVFQAISKDKLHIIDGKVDMCRVDSRVPYTQYMYYKLVLASTLGSRYILEGKKVMNPYLLASYVWSESTTLHVNLRTLDRGDELRECRGLNQEVVDLHGKLHISMFELLKCVMSLRGKRKGKFVSLLLQNLWRTYISQQPRKQGRDFSKSSIIQAYHPQSTLHKLMTEDGCVISCRQWRSTRDTCKLGEELKKFPVLLLNGYSTESYFLPTETKDLVRTLLGEGYEVWLLQSRTHPLHPSNNFTIEDIGKFDIPAAVKRIIELQGQNVKIHVIAHCVGGMAIHIALLGGHISSAHIASLSCTNSSMFFKLTTSSMVKMRLPLIPVSMAILGRNTILSIHDTPNENYRRRLLKSVARLMPRCERCINDECEVFSGIFGNTFWHENISDTMHELLHKSLHHLPMSAFSHLRKICTTGFIVDKEGGNRYLIHPERMPLPTLYISGGRSILVTPETTFLANQYMRLHQPRFQHKRVVVEGFGHSDLLIGEKSPDRVFPHFLSHMRLAEKGMGAERVDCNKEKMVLWDGSHDGIREPGAWGSIIFLFILLFFMLFVYF